jgi:hypothetical protein
MKKIDSEPKEFFGNYIKIKEKGSAEQEQPSFAPEETLTESLKRLFKGRYWSSSEMGLKDMIKEINKDNEDKQ